MAQPLARGSNGVRVPPLIAKNLQNIGKKRKKLGKEENIRKKMKNLEEKAKIGTVLSLCPF